MVSCLHLSIGVLTWQEVPSSILDHYVLTLLLLYDFAQAHKNWGPLTVLSEGFEQMMDINSVLLTMTSVYSKACRLAFSPPLSPTFVLWSSPVLSVFA